MSSLSRLYEVYVVNVVSMSSLCRLYIISLLSLCHLYIVSMSPLCSHYCLYVVSMSSLSHLYVISLLSLCSHYCLYVIAPISISQSQTAKLRLPPVSLELTPSDYATGVLPTVLWKHSQKMKTAAWLPTLVLDSIYISITYWLRIFSSVTLFQCGML